MSDVKTILPACSLVEILVTNGTTEYTFGRQEKITDKKIRSIIISPTGYKATKNADIQDAGDGYLYLKEAGTNYIIYEGPARNFIYTPGIPALQMIELGGKKIDWEKSELRFSAGATITTGRYFQMTVVYED